MNALTHTTKHIRPIAALMAMLAVFSCKEDSGKNRLIAVAFAEGDLVFRKGFGPKTEAVLHVDSAGLYSHIGIVVRQDTAFGVVHITPGEREKGDSVDRVKIEAPEIFFGNKRAKHGGVYRLRDTSFGIAAARQALRLLDKKIAFDHDYSLDDTTRMYCTQFVWYCYRLAGVDVSNGRRNRLDNVPLYSGVYIFPSDIYKNSDLQTIYTF